MKIKTACVICKRRAKIHCIENGQNVCKKHWVKEVG